VNTEKKSLLVALLIIYYGAISIPAYWLRDTSLVAFNALMALYVEFAVVAYILVVIFNMFIPHCRHTARAITASSTTFIDETKTSTTIEANTLLDRTKTSTTRKDGF
jgi:hypothetical protein